MSLAPVRVHIMRPSLASDFRKGCEDEVEVQPCEDRVIVEALVGFP